MTDTIQWARTASEGAPRVGGEVPGPKSREMHERASRIMKGSCAAVLGSAAVLVQ